MALRTRLKPELMRVFLLLLLMALGSLSASAKTEDELIQALGSARLGDVTAALGQLEKHYPTSAKSVAAISKLVKDSRSEVRRKAARALGNLHAEVNQSTIKDLCALLKASSEDEVMDGLKALRGLKAPEAVAEILPALKHPSANVVRDACRTLAVLGNKDIIPYIEVLLKNSEPEVQKDAKDAIAKLRAKSRT
jgi:HEAT repeat protein